MTHLQANEEIPFGPPHMPLAEGLTHHDDQGVRELACNVASNNHGGVNRKTLRSVPYWVFGDQSVLWYISQVSFGGTWVSQGNPHNMSSTATPLFA
jgi:hypothetical protein